LSHYFTLNTIDLGEIRQGGSGDQAQVALTDSDWSHASFACRDKTSSVPVGFNVTVSRLTPALLIDCRDSVVLFAGKKKAAGIPTPEWKKLPLKQKNKPYTFPHHIYDRWNIEGNSGSHLPRHFAISDGKTVRYSDTLESDAIPKHVDRGWILCWFGNASYFHATTHPLISTAGYDTHESWYRADCPVLLVFNKQPESLSLEHAPTAGVKVTMPRGGTIAMMPLLGASLPPASETEAWKNGLPEDILRKCNEWAARCAFYPDSVSESYAYDEKTGTVSITENITFRQLSDRPDAVRFAPPPPCLLSPNEAGSPCP